jgi:hypothetical protein
MDQLKKLSEVFTFAVPFLILCSCIQLITYYYYWNIPIVDYLSISELLFLFIKPLLTILVLAAIYFSFNLLLVAGVAIYVKWDGSRQKQVKAPGVETLKAPESPAKKKDGDSVVAKGVLAIGALVIAWFFVEGIWFDYDIVPVVVVHIVLWMAAIALSSRFLLKSTEGKVSLESFVAGTIIALISASFFYGRYQAHYAETNPIPHRIVFADGSRIESDSNLIYLGKTGSYYFFYDKAKSQASIIPVGEAKRTEILGRAPILKNDSPPVPQAPANSKSGEK